LAAQPVLGLASTVRSIIPSSVSITNFTPINSTG
jgi:hypothetical protein